MPRFIIHFHLIVTAVSGQPFLISQKSFLAHFAKRRRFGTAVLFCFSFVLLSINPFRFLEGSKIQICQSCRVPCYGTKFACCFRLPQFRTFMQLFFSIIELYFQTSTLCRKCQIKFLFFLKKNTLVCKREKCYVPLDFYNVKFQKLYLRAHK